jgi:hypothetical protein
MNQKLGAALQIRDLEEVATDAEWAMADDR